MDPGDNPDTAVTPLLDPIQARVLACLIEKEATTPEQYPLTANAVLVACNQKTGRDPVLELEPGAVGHALRTLETDRLVRSIHGSRAQRYDHRTDDVYAVSPEQRVLLALLMLRGPQTAGELLSRSERLYRFADLDQVRTVLERLANRTPQLVTCLARGSGQREDRYAHLLCGAEAIPEGRVAGPPSAPAVDGAGSGGGEKLVERIARLEHRIAILEASLARLQDGSTENE